jgi:Flp pilus assembly protein TadD
MSRSTQARLAEKYLVDDLPGAALVGARLNGILQKIEAGETLTSLAQAFLTLRGLISLLALATGQIDRPTFEETAARERSDRIHERSDHIQKAKSEADKAAAEQAQKAEAMNAAIKAHFAAMENDPVLRKRREARKLRDRFNIGFIESEHYPRAMRLLKQVASAKRLTPEDVAWLSTEAVDCWTDALQQAWHRLEAEALTKAWEENGDVWNVVNASAHWRKAHEPQRALEVTAEALNKAGRSPQPRSALLTTRGGAMRDAGRLTEARTLALEAHELTPADFRPCTLLGAVSMELGDLAVGHRWYAKAEALGAERRAIDQDLRALLIRSEPDASDRIRAYLLEQDPERFDWLRKWSHKTSSSRR